MKKLRAYTNVLRFRLNRALKREAVSNYPVEAYVEPTSFCNLRCPACPTGLRLGERASKAIDERLFKAALDEVGDYIFQLWMYNWGEPLLHRQTPELIRYAKGKDLKVILSSNLSVRLSDEYVERLVGSGLDTLIVGADGVTDESYARYRVGGSLPLVRENMLRIRAAKARLRSPTPHVLWQFLVFRHNEGEIAGAIAAHEQWGADSIQISPAEMPMPPHDEGFEPSSIPQYNMYHAENRFVRETEKQLTEGRACSWLYGSLVLNPGGKVSPCCGTSAEANDFGEYAGRGDFFKVWNNENFRRARGLFTRRRARQSAQQPGEKDTQEIMRRVDGMAVEVNHSLAADELICHKCPIPFRQGDVDVTILDVSYKLLHSFTRDLSLSHKLRCALAYLLMGAPYWRRIAREGIRKALGHTTTPKTL